MLGGASLADAMLDMLGDESMMAAGGMGAHVHNRMHLVREAFMSLHTGRLPPHMLLSDRDFDENDYEMLLALDEGVENRKGAVSLLVQSACVNDRHRGDVNLQHFWSCPPYVCALDTSVWLWF